MSVPRVSVVMAVFDAREYVEEAVASILGQTFRDFELVAIDDGSRDGSGELLERMAERDGRVRLTRRPNTGLARALNEGLASARGDYVARMDADDVALPERLERQVRFLDAHPECVCLGTRVQLIEPYGSPLFVPDHALDHDEIERRLLAGSGWAIVHPTALMRRAALEKVGGYREAFDNAEDLDLFLRLAEVGRLANLPDVLLHYRQHLASINHTRFENQRRLVRRVVEEAWKRRGRVPPSDGPDAQRRASSAGEQLRTWAWAALKAGETRAARRHAWAAVVREPHRLESWRTLYCAVRGH